MLKPFTSNIQRVVYAQKEREAETTPVPEKPTFLEFDADITRFNRENTIGGRRFGSKPDEKIDGFRL